MKQQVRWSVGKLLPAAIVVGLGLGGVGSTVIGAQGTNPSHVQQAQMAVKESVARTVPVPAVETPAPRGWRRLPGQMLPALVQATPLAPSAAPHSKTESLTLTLVLKRDRPQDFAHYLKQVYDPVSALYHRFLTPEQLAEHFGPSRGDYDSLLGYLRGHGFKVLRGSKDRLTLTVRGTRAQIAHAFAVHIGDYRIDHHYFHANDNAPALPERLASHVEAISGFSNLAQPTAVDKYVYGPNSGSCAVV